MTDRPNGACITHRPPTENRPWALADPGYRTCKDCYSRIHDWLSPLTTDDDGRPDSIPGLYVMLSPLPGSGGGARRAPGFASRSPANDRIIAMRDPRSAHIQPGDPHSVPGVLAGWVQQLLEERGHIPPARNVPAMVTFLDRNLDYITRQDWVADFVTELRELYRQLRNIGKRYVKIGQCPNTINIDAAHTKTCGTNLFAPLQWRGDKEVIIKCWAPDCGREWPKDNWPDLGDLLDNNNDQTSATAS